MSGHDVNKALAMIADEQGDAGPAITAEQARHFSEIAAIDDTEKKATAVTQTIDRLLAEVEEGDRRLKSMFESVGVEPEMVERFLDGDRISPESRRELDEQAKQFQSEVMQAVNDEARQLAGPAKTSKAPRLGRMRV
ncbi:MAG: hypothetical protein AAGG46_05110 [Planctomycetota bacterium]